MQEKIRNNKILPSLMNLLVKLPIPITILIFVGNSSTQSICYIVYFIFYLILMAIVPYRRRIYRVTIFFGGLMLIINALGAVLVAKMATGSFYFEVVWFVTILILLILTFLQALTNY